MRLRVISLICPLYSSDEGGEHATKWPGGKVVSAKIIFVFLLATIAHSTRTAWSSCDVCVNWNEQLASYLHYTGSLE